MTTDERRHIRSISGAGLLVLAFAGACVGDVETEPSSSQVVLAFDDAIAWGDRAETGEIRAALVTHDTARDLIARMEVTAEGGSWEDAEGNRRELVLDQDATGDGITAITQFPTTPEEGAMELYTIWAHSTSDSAYEEGCRTYEGVRPCTQSGGSTCCQYIRVCEPGRCDREQQPGESCWSYDITYECYPNSSGGGEHDCSTKF